MPKLILRCNYLKNSPPAHLANYINYIGTREGVEKLSGNGPVTKGQRELIQKLLHDFPDAAELFEYEDYQTAPTRGNASEFITRALEDNYDQIAKRDNYL